MKTALYDNRPDLFVHFSQRGVRAAVQGDVIAAIKVVRVERNLGLKEATDLTAAYIRSQLSLQQKLE